MVKVVEFFFFRQETHCTFYGILISYFPFPIPDSGYGLFHFNCQWIAFFMSINCSFCSFPDTPSYFDGCQTIFVWRFFGSVSARYEFNNLQVKMKREIPFLAYFLPPSSWAVKALHNTVESYLFFYRYRNADLIKGIIRHPFHIFCSVTLSQNSKSCIAL